LELLLNRYCCIYLVVYIIVFVYARARVCMCVRVERVEKWYKESNIN
jgi:hypothetical protein